MVTATAYLVTISGLILAECISVRTLGPGSDRFLRLCTCPACVVLIYLCSQHCDLDNTATIIRIRSCFVLVEITLAILYTSAFREIRRRNDTRILTYVDPTNPSVVITTTVIAYDRAKLSSTRRSQFGYFAAWGIIHYLFGFTLPLFVGMYASLVIIVNEELLDIHVYDELLCSRLVRPWVEQAHLASIENSGDGPVTWEKLWSYTKPTISIEQPRAEEPRHRHHAEATPTRPGPTPWKRGAVGRSERASSSASSLSTSSSVFSRSSSASTSTSISSMSPHQATSRVDKPGFFDQLDRDKYCEWIQSLPSYELQKEHRRARVTKYGQALGLGTHAVTAPVTTVATAGLSTAAHGGAMLYHSGKRTLNSMQQKVCEQEMGKRGISDIDWRAEDGIKIAASLIPALEEFF